MKKIFLIFIMLIGLQINVAAQGIIKKVGDFSTVRVFDKIPVELIASDEAKVEVSGAKKEDVQIINKNGELKIRMATLKMMSGDDIHVKVYFKNLETIESSEGAIINGDDAIKAEHLYLNAKEGAVINVNTETQKISIKANSGGQINAKGNSEVQDIVITSGGKYIAKDLKSKHASISINAGGEGIINVSGTVEAKTRAGGKIEIFGKPSKVDKKTIAGGKITVH